MANGKVKSYTRKDGTKVKAHVRKSTMDGRFRAVGKRASRDLEGLIRSTKSKKGPMSSAQRAQNKRSLSKMTRKVKSSMRSNRKLSSRKHSNKKK